MYYFAVDGVLPEHVEEIEGGEVVFVEDLEFPFEWIYGGDFYSLIDFFYFEEFRLWFSVGQDDPVAYH